MDVFNNILRYFDSKNNQIKKYCELEKAIVERKQEAQDLAKEYSSYKKECEELIKGASLNNKPIAEISSHIEERFNKYFVTYINKLGEIKKSVEDNINQKDKILKKYPDLKKEIEKAKDSETSSKKKMKKVMSEFESGKLKSSSGEKITDRKQAIAIAYNEAGLNKAQVDESIVTLVKGYQNGLISSIDFAKLQKELSFFVELEKAEKNTIQGGKADNKTIKQIADKHKVTEEEVKKQLQIGIEVEKEHVGDDKEKAQEIAMDHLWEQADYYTAKKPEDWAEKELKKEKAEESKIEKGENSELEKALNLSHLVAKKVQVKDKNGKIHYAIRWINPNSGESEKVIETKEHFEGTIEEKVDKIVNSNLSNADKIRHLVSNGIYDKGVLSLLVGCNYAQAYGVLSKIDIDLKSLINTPSDNTEVIKNKIREEQSHNDTSEEKEKNTTLRKIEDLDELWDNYDKNLRRVATGRHKFAIAYGSGGVGKTYSFRRIVKELQLREFDDEIQPNKDQYDFVIISGKITPSQVYASMYRHRDKLIVFDDCDSFLSTEEVQGFLKAGLDTGENTKISNISSRKMYQVEGDKESGDIPNTFRFSGRVIAISNLASKDIDQAVKSRALSSNLTMTVDETIQKLSTIKDKIEIFTADKSQLIDVSQKARDFAFEILNENKNKLANDLNTRTYSNAILLANDGFEAGDKEDRIKREIVGYFDAVTGYFDNQIRKIK